MIRRTASWCIAVRRGHSSNEPIGAGVSGSFRELMVSIHDTVPHTVNVIEAGNPPGQPIEVALEAGKRCPSRCRTRS